MSRIVPQETGIDGFTADTAAPLVRIIGTRSVGTMSAFLTLPIGNHIGRVIDHDIEVHLHATLVRSMQQRTQLGVGAEVRIDAGKVRNPITMIPGRFMPRGPLHRLIDKDRGQPNGGNTQGLEIVEAPNHALQIAAMIEALVGGIVAGLKPLAA